MGDYQDIDGLLKAIDRQQRVAKIEEKIRPYLKPEQQEELDRKLKAIGAITGPASPDEIHDHTDKVREVVKQFMGYFEENLPETTQEQKDTLIFEVGLNDNGVLVRFQEEEHKRADYRYRMNVKNSENRLLIEEYLTSSFQFVCKRETEIAQGILDCCYGDRAEEDGYWHFIFDTKGKLLHHYEIESQLRMVYQKRLAVLKKIKMGADLAVAEKILAEAGYMPIGELERDNQGRESVQKYGFVEEKTAKPIFLMVYNSKDEIKRKRFIQSQDLISD
jgi:hypothetical protein